MYRVMCNDARPTLSTGQHLPAGIISSLVWMEVVDAPAGITLFFFSRGCNKKAIPSLEGNELFEQECKAASHWLTRLRSTNQRCRFNVCYWSNMGALSADIGDVASWRPSQQSAITAEDRINLTKTFWRVEKWLKVFTTWNNISLVFKLYFINF